MMDRWLERGYEAGIYGALARHFGRFVWEMDGRPEAEPLAVVAALLAERSLDGDVCLDLNRLPPLLDGFPLPSPATLEEQFARSRVVAMAGKEEGKIPLLLFDRPRLYLYRHYLDEVGVAEGVRSRLHNRPLLEPEELRPFLDLSDPDQRLAVALAFLRPFLVITGGPGTGKSTTVTALLRLLHQLRPELRVAVAAPTGKAAARLSDLLARAGLSERAATLHRLLRLGRRERFGPDFPLPADLVVVDEASMVDLALAARLFAALPASCRLILLGDRHQLASVEAGSLLGDLTGGEAPPAYPEEVASWLGRAGVEVAPREGPEIASSLVVLRRNYRFSREGGIGRLAEAVRKGEVEEALAALEAGGEELRWLPLNGEEAVEAALSWLEDRFGQLLQTRDPLEALALVERHQLLVVLREGPFGEGGIVRRFEERLLKRGLGTAPVYPRLPILIAQNDYELELFNGDLGLIWEVAGRLRAFFRQGEGVRSFAVRQLPEWRKAWALTVHKAQGSEFEEVALLLPDRESPLLTRELLYTAITRARRRFTLIGDASRLRFAVYQRTLRASGLAERLGWA